MRHGIFHGDNLHSLFTSRKQLIAFLQKNNDVNLLFCFTQYSLMTGLNSKVWCVMLTRIGLFILQHFLYISCLRTVILNHPAHCLKGELAEPDVAIHLQNHRLFWRILIKPDLAIGKAYMDGKNSAVYRNILYLQEIFQFSQTRQTECRDVLLSNRQFI